MKMRLLAALTLATSGLICGFSPGAARPVALDSTLSPSAASAYQSVPSGIPMGALPTPIGSSAPVPVPIPTGAPPPVPTGAPVFESDFSGNSLDTSVWATCYAWANPATGCTNFGNIGEEEWYLPSQDQVSGGVLQLVAQPELTSGQNQSGQPEEYQCRSGMVTTLPGFSFEYGLIQIVAQIPSTAGLWPALWLVATNGVWPPEIDILEAWGPPLPQTGVFFHPVGGGRVGADPPTGNLAVGWHTFTLDWTPSSLTWWIDGQEALTTNQDIPNEDLYLIADLADYSLASPGSCNGSLLMRSVKVWQGQG
jgi:beta-glucanase (GH16 family)